jgi:hypothetical protein
LHLLGAVSKNTKKVPLDKISSTSNNFKERLTKVTQTRTTNIKLFDDIDPISSLRVLTSGI